MLRSPGKSFNDQLSHWQEYLVESLEGLEIADLSVTFQHPIMQKLELLSKAPRNKLGPEQDE